MSKKKDDCKEVAVNYRSKTQKKLIFERKEEIKKVFKRVDEILNFSK